MGNTFSYMRISTKEERGLQKYNRQEKALKKYAEEHHGKPLFQRNNAGQVIRPKFELISSHTARRSGVTNLYKTGLLDTRQIMSISGHQSERVFESYIKIGIREQTRRIAMKLLEGAKDGKNSLARKGAG